MKKESQIEFPEPKIARFFFADSRIAFLWLLVRIYVGYEWFIAGWGKVTNTAWAGEKAGSALQGFLTGALTKTAGAHPDVSGWYAEFLKTIVMHHPIIFSYVVSYGELLVGIGLMLGTLTGIAAFFGACMNLSYLFAGTVSINPILLLIELFLILAWRNAGWLGLDRWLLPLLGVPWQKGKLFGKKNST